MQRLKKIYFSSPQRFSGSSVYHGFDMADAPHRLLCTIADDNDRRLIRVCFISGPLKGEVFAVPYEVCGPFQYEKAEKK